MPLASKCCIFQSLSIFAATIAVTAFIAFEPVPVLAAPPATPPGSVHSILHEADLLIKNKHLSEGRQRLLMLVARPDAPADAYCALAETYLDYEGVDEDTPAGVAAMRGLQTALQKDPKCSRAYRDLATLSNLHGNFPQCVEYATKSLTIPGANPEALRQRAIAYSHMNRLADAVKDINDYIAQGHPAATNYMLRGDFQRAMKQYAEAAASYQKALDVAVGAGKYQERCFNQLVKCLELQSKFTEIDALLTKELAKDKRNFELLDLRGQYRMKDKKIAAALDDFTAALNVEPASAFYEHRAAAYDALGRKKEAEQDRVAGKKAVSKDFL